MSSTYAVLCLSHDPAVVAADGGWQQPEAAERAIEAGIEGHEQCDLLIGRYSASLIELGCPNSYAERRKGQHRCLMHTRTKWVDLGWLRMLALAQEQPVGSALRKAAGDHVGNCWPVQRLSRLRAELSLGVPVASGGSCAAVSDRIGLNRDRVYGCILDDGHKGTWHEDQGGAKWRQIVQPAPAEPAVPPPCSINHDCPGQPRPEPLTARGEARCQSQHRAEGEPLAQCALKVHPSTDAHTDYDEYRMTIKPPHGRPAELPWIVWRDQAEGTDHA